MLILDILLRYSAVTMLFLIAVLAMRDGRKFQPTVYIVLATITIAFMLLGTSRPELQLPQRLHIIVRFGDVGNIVFIWWLGLAVFQDNFRLRWPHWLVLALNLAVLLPNRYFEMQGINYFNPTLNYGLDIVTLGIMIHLIFVTLRGREDDLVESRRRLRLYFILAMIGATVTAMLAENVLTATHPEFLRTLRCIIIFPLALWGVLWLTQLHPEKITFKDPAALGAAQSNIDPRDQLLLESLKFQIETERIYKAPGLTIRKLAEILNTPEHRLRNLINAGLGYRNFSSFLNHYRIEAIKVAFSEPQNSRIPVLTIALDYGYNSLAPFNRAFRDAEGMTPSAYRKTLKSSAIM